MRLALLIAAIAFIAVPAASAGDITITYATGGTPTLTATYTGGKIVAKWTYPPGQTEMTPTNIHWSNSDPSTTAQTGASEGAAMNCWLTGPSNGVHGCTGGTDLGSEPKYTITGLSPGTYYVQVLGYGLKDEWINGNGPYKIHYNAYSNVAPVTVTKSGGGTITTGDTSGGTSARGATSVTFDVAATVKHADGTVTKGTQTVLVDGDLVESYGNPVSVTWKQGKGIVLGRNSQLAYTPDYSNPRWRLKSGELYAKNVPQVFPPVGTEYVKGGQYVMTRHGDDTVISGITGGVYVVFPSSTYNAKQIRPGEQRTLRRDGTMTAARTWKPPARPFWK